MIAAATATTTSGLRGMTTDYGVRTELECIGRVPDVLHYSDMMMMMMMLETSRLGSSSLARERSLSPTSTMNWPLASTLLLSFEFRIRFSLTKSALELVGQAKPPRQTLTSRAKGQRQRERETDYHRDLTLDISGRLLKKGGMISTLP
jgi:hypothetical protein